MQIVQEFRVIAFTQTFAGAIVSNTILCLVSDQGDEANIDFNPAVVGDLGMASLADLKDGSTIKLVFTPSHTRQLVPLSPLNMKRYQEFRFNSNLGVYIAKHENTIMLQHLGPLTIGIKLRLSRRRFFQLKRQFKDYPASVINLTIG